MAVDGRYYFVLATDDPTVGMAFVRRSVYEPPPIDCRPVGTWVVPVFDLRPGRLADFAPNDAGLRLCSARLRSVLEASRHPADAVQWLHAEVLDGDQPSEYYALHLPSCGDVLDEGRSIMAGDFVVKPVLDARKIGPRRVFGFPDARLTVSESVRAAIETAGCTGLDFAPAPVL